MGLFKTLLPALALASGVFAQGSPCSGTKTIQNAGDASALSSCQTITGSVHFASGVSGAVTLSGVRQITGDLIINNAGNLTSLEADSLSSIGGSWTMNGATSLSALNMPMLSTVNRIVWSALPQLQGLVFTTGVRKVDTLNIQDTNLQTLDGFNITSASTIYLANNKYLMQVAMPVSEVTTELSLNSNGDGNLVASFPNLTSAGMIAISNCSSVDLGSLMNTTGLFILSGNSFKNMSAPKLTTSGGFALNNNNDLTSFSFPVYQSSSNALNVENNTAFTGTINFPALTRVAGAANFLGSWSDVTLPKINTVRGTMTLESTKDIQKTCDRFNSISGSGQPLYVTPICKPGAGGSNTGGDGPTNTDSSASGPTSSNAAVANVGEISRATLGVSGAVAALFALLL